ncbi:tetratricopeptide repeat protein [Dactylosporangium sp. McL0621]|uniref:tetratricopeptide repeat protein n=1 Tax=Dactylosporangium sp. McL0621 TaxID=3415678 RepID=UPI003CF0D3DA
MVDEHVPNAEAVRQFDLDSAQSLADFAQACDRLRARRSYAELAKAVRPRPLPQATLSDLINAKTTPTRDTLITFLTACGLSTEAAQRPWITAWERVSTAHQPHPTGAVRVRQARPRLLGVHATIKAPGSTGEMPPYVPRDLDAELHAAIQAAAADGGFVLLLGGSSVGKTRALYEAIHAELPEWWLLHPADSPAITVHAETPTPRTVVWLDELQRYLNHAQGPLAASVQRLIAVGTVVVATLWPDEYAVRTIRSEAGAPDPYADDRHLLRLAQVVLVPETFSSAERQRGETLAVNDERLRIALFARDAGVTQVLAGGPELVQRWELAPGQHCYGRAVITAALDAGRVGAHHIITADFLRAAAPAYLTPKQRATAPPDWLRRALAYATTTVHGATACLNPIPAAMGEVAGYATADYLHQHALRSRRCVHLPPHTWDALVAHHHPHDRMRLALNAERRGADAAAIALYRQVIEHGDEDEQDNAMYQLVRVLGRQGRIEELRELADGGSPLAIDQLADLFVQQGRAEDAIAILSEHLDSCYGVYGPADLVVESRLGRLLADLGRVDELRAQASVGYTFAATSLYDLLAARGNFEELRQRASDDNEAAIWLNSLLLRYGHIDELRARANAGDQFALGQLVEHLAGNGSFDEALAALRRHGGPGATVISENVEAMKLAAEGNMEELERRAAAGNEVAATGAAMLTVDRMIGTGDLAAAVRLVRERARHGGDELVSEHLVGVLIERDHLDQVRSLADGGHRYAADRLTNLLASQARIAELQDEVAAGTPYAAERLSALTERPRG